MLIDRIVALAAVSSALFLATPAAAESFRCKGDLANIGDSKASVVLKCGEPAMKDNFCKQTPVAPGSVVPSTNARAVVPCETVDEWTYNPGSGQFLTLLRFENGTLQSIKYGDRVR
ncbi:DUF2845 domain-containing protein [soil metagenome]